MRIATALIHAVILNARFSPLSLPTGNLCGQIRHSLARAFHSRRILENLLVYDIFWP